MQLGFSIIMTVYNFRLVFFFQAEDGIRDRNVTGVQTCALPIFCIAAHETVEEHKFRSTSAADSVRKIGLLTLQPLPSPGKLNPRNNTIRFLVELPRCVCAAKPQFVPEDAKSEGSV